MFTTDVFNLSGVGKRQCALSADSITVEIAALYRSVSFQRLGDCGGAFTIDIRFCSDQRFVSHAAKAIVLNRRVDMLFRLMGLAYLTCCVLHDDC
jgi:hypothetical protein